MSLVSRYLEPAVVERLNYLQLSARSVVEGTTTGQHRSPVKGASIEFRQHRFYVPGDEPRRLDWRVLGRTDRPYVKEYDEETNLRCVLMVDCSGSMGYGGKSPGRLERVTKFDYAAKLAAALAYLMLGQTESVGLGLFSKGLNSYLPPRAGTGQLSRVIDGLERAAPKGASGGAAAVHAVADRLDRRALVIIVSDLFWPQAAVREALARLRHDRHEIIVMRVLDRDEVEFPFRRWTRLRGLESERARMCEPALVRKSYLENFRRHATAVEDACRATGAEFRSFSTDKAVIDALTTFLQRRAAR
jgi:uncharacterized protein (DUF58 family)